MTLEDYLDKYLRPIERKKRMNRLNEWVIIKEKKDIELDGNDKDLAETISEMILSKIRNSDETSFTIHYHPTSKSVFDELFREKLHKLAKYYSDKYNREFSNNMLISDALNDLIKNGKNVVKNDYAKYYNYSAICFPNGKIICVRSNYLMEVKPYLWYGIDDTQLFYGKLDDFLDLLGYKPEVDLLSELINY